ncbi:MAG TPA: 4-alpha-glucanotransferase, partial [Candidatus Omnitrophota bacterium]|nr:4-alpha-glucanotransferase [Candidatus Omnitrophota bacterium]
MRKANGSLPVIIHIQDAHGVLSAQRSTEKILKYLHDTYQIRNVYLEGASGPLNPDPFRFSPERKKNERIWRELFKRRILNGADLRFLRSGGEITGFGAEEEAVYRENFLSFRKIAGARDETSVFIGNLYQRLETLATHFLSKDGQAFLRAYWKFRQKEMPVRDFVRLLSRAAEETGCLDSVIRREQVKWPNLSRLIYLEKVLKDPDPESLLRDKSRLVRELESKNVRPDLLAKVSELEKEKDVRFLFGELFEATRDHPFSAEAYPDLMKWAKTRTFGLEIDPRGLFEETERLGGVLLARLAKSQKAKKLVYIFRKTRLLQDLFQLELVRQDWEKIRGNRNSFSPRLLAKMTDRLSEGIAEDSATTELEDAKAGRIFEQAIRFYENVRRRDAILAGNTLREIKKEGASSAVLITGGFHSTGLAEAFEEQGVGFIEIEPAIEGEISSEDYFARMTGSEAFAAQSLAIPDALQATEILERLEGEDELIRRAVRAVLSKGNFVSKSHAEGARNYPEVKAASLGGGGESPELPAQVRNMHFWDIGAQFENGIGQFLSIPEGEDIVLKVKVPVGLRERIARLAMYTDFPGQEDKIFEKKGQEGDFDVWEARFENPKEGNYAFMPFVEIRETGEILRYWAGNPGENFIVGVRRRLFEDIRVQFENGVRNVVTRTPGGEILLRVRTPVGLREEISRIAVETELPGQDGLEFERKSRDGDFDVWEVRLKAGATGGYLFLPYLEMKDGARTFTYWAGHDWQKSSARVFPAWATQGLNVGISFIKTLRRPGTSQARSGTFTDLMWYLKDLKENPDPAKRIGINALMLLPLTDSFTFSPYEAISPFGINPAYIDWEKVPYEGRTPEEKFESFKRIMREDPGFRAFLKSPAFQDIRNYADTKAIYALRTDGEKNLPPENIRAQVRQTTEYARLVGSETAGDGFYIFEQYVALMQLKETIAFAHRMGVRLFFDLPFFQNDQGALAIHHPDYFEWENGKVRNPVYDKLGGRDKQTWHGQGYWDYDRVRQFGYEPILRIFRYWLDLGFDGFRWDAAHMSAPEIRRAVNEKIYRGRDILPITEQLGGTDDDAHDLARNGFLLYRSIEYPAKGGLGGLEAQLTWTAHDYHFGQNTMHDTPRVPFAFQAITCTDGSLEQEKVTTVAVQRLVNYTQEIGLFLQGDEWGQGGPNPNDMRYNEAGNEHWHWDVPSPMDSSGRRYDIREDLGAIFRVRREHPVFSRPGTLAFLRNSNWPNVSSFLRRSENETVLVVINVTPRRQEGSVYFDGKAGFESLGLPRDHSFSLTNLETGEKTEFVPGQDFSSEENALRFKLEPGQAYIFSLREISGQTAASLGGTSSALPRDPFYQALAQGYEKFISFDPFDKPAIYAGGRGTHFGDQEWGRDFAISLLGLIQMAAGGESVDFPEGRKSAKELSKELIRRWAGIDPEGRPGMDPDHRKRIDGKNPDGDVMYNVINWYGGFNRNTVDAPLWFSEAVFQYVRATGDYDFLKEPMREGQSLLEVLWEIVDRYRMSGEDLVRNGIAERSIQMDPATGFILVPREKYTWMDTEFTPRQGYPVEIQALWFNALRRVADLTEKLRPEERQRIQEARTLADRMKENFPRYFWNAGNHSLYDILGTDGVMTPDDSVRKGWADPAVRPNQLFAVLFGLAEGEKAREILGTIKAKLLIPGALRSLAPEAAPFAVYRHDFEVAERDGLNKNAAYHNGLGWVWLYPFYFLAAAQNGMMSPEEAESQIRKDLEPILQYNPQRSLPELLSGDSYDGVHARRGPDAQAWSVATAIAVLHQLRNMKTGASLGEDHGVRRSERRSVMKLTDLPDDDRIRIVQGDPGSYFSLTTGQVYFPRDKGIRPIKINLERFPPGLNFFAVYRGRKLMSVRHGLFEPRSGKNLKDYPVVWKRKILSTPGEIDAFVTKQGLRELFALGMDHPGELKQLLAYFLRGADLTLEELEKLIWGFRSLHLGEVTRFHGFPDRGLNFVDVFLKTLLEKAALFSNLDEKDQEVIIRVFINWVYKEYRKDPETKIRQLEAKIGRSDLPLLNRLKERVRDEFLVAAAFRPEHIQTPLEPHEAIGAYRLRQHDRYALLDGARVGKTIQALAALEMNDRTLIVSPAGVIDTWLEEERKSFSDRLGVEFVSADSSAGEVQEAIGRLKGTDRQAVVVLRGSPSNRRQLLDAVRGRKNTLLHVSYETLRQMSDEELGVLQEALDGIILDEWQYAENFVSGESRLNAQQAFVVQKINPKKKWVLTATPYRTDPHKLYALFHYLLKDSANPPEWARADGGYVFKHTFTDSFEGFRLLNRELGTLSLRRHREDVWEIYEEGKTPAGTLAIPRKTPPVDCEWEMSPEMTRQALDIVRSFKDFVADTYNPAVRTGRVRRVADREKPAQILRHEDLNIPDKIKFLRWIETDPPHVGLDPDGTYWERLDEVVREQLADPERKIVIAAQNVFMVEDILKRYGGYGVARIDGRVTGWARDESGEIRRDSNGRPITAKNYERHRFQEDPGVRIMVINVRAGVGIDLSRADAWIYAQMPETFTEMYQSMARAFGPNRPDHPRETVNVIFMISKYGQKFGEGLSGQDREYYEAGTVTQIHKRRLEAQQLRYQRILEGPFEVPETFWDEGDDLSPEEEEKGLPPAAGAFFPDLLADFSGGRGLTGARKRTLRIAAQLGGLYAVADPEQRRAILELAHDGHVLREDLTPLVRAIVEIAEKENFDPEDFKILASLKGISNRYLRRKIYRGLPGFLNQTYRGAVETEGVTPTDETAATLSGVVRNYRWGSESIPDYVLMAGLIFLQDAEDPERRKESFVTLAEQITRRGGNLRMRFQELLSCLAAIQTIPVAWLPALEDERFDLGERLALLRKLASIAPLLEDSFGEVFGGSGNDFPGLAKIIEEKSPAVLQNYFREALGLEIAPERLWELGAEEIENVYGLLISLKRGEEESREGDRKELFRREIGRFGEALSHVFDGTFPAWRNRQEGARRYGARVEFMADQEDFWRVWTEETRVTRDTPGWERLGDFVLEEQKVEKRIRSVLSELLTEVRSDGKILEEMEGSPVARLFENYQADPAFLEVLRGRQSRLETIRRKIFESEPLTAAENGFLRSLGIGPSERRSVTLKRLDEEYEPGEAALLWMELNEMSVRDEADSFSMEKVAALLKRTEERIDEAGISPLIENLLTDLGNLMTLSRRKMRRRYRNVEIIVTSDPFLIMRRGMLDPQLRNCFELDGDPKLVRSLLDDLGSRNKMLVIVKANGRYQAVAIAKVKTDKKDRAGKAAPEDGEPVLFLERILERKGGYDFEEEILEVLRETKAARMRETPLLAVKASKSVLNPVTLWSTGGYGEEEYSEPQFRLRKNHYLQKEEDGSAPVYRADGSNITAYQHEVKARVIGSSLGVSVSPEQAAVIREISDAFSRLSNAEGKDETIEDIMALVSDGALMARFPCPGGGNVRKPFYFGGMKNLEKVRLRITGLAEGKFRLEFFCRPEGEAKFREEPTVVIWDGGRYVREGDDRREKEALSRKIIAAFEKVGTGETVDLGDVRALIDLKQGRLSEVFPCPGSGVSGKRIGFGAGEKLEAVRLKITGLGDGRYQLDFYYRKEGEKKFRENPAVVIWDEKIYRTLRDWTAKKIAEAYDEIKGGAKEKEIEDVSVFINKKDGRLKEAFLKPDGRNFGESFGFGLEGDLSKVKLKITDLGEGKYRLEFYYQKQGEPAFRKEPAVIIWDGATYKTLRDFTVQAIREAFATLEKGESREVDVGDADVLIDKMSGTFRKGFPGPGDYEREEPFSFGGGTNLDSVRLRITGEGEGRYCLELTCRKKIKTEAETEGAPEFSEKVVLVIWNGTQYVREDGMHEKKDERKSVRDAIVGIFDSINQGVKKDGEIEEVGCLFDSEAGRFFKSFPRPDGRNVGGKGVGIGVGGKTEAGKVKIIGTGKGSFRLEITYRKRGEKDFRKDPAVILWDGKAYKTLKDSKIEEIRKGFKQVEGAVRVRIENVDVLINKIKKRLQQAFPVPTGGILPDRISLNIGERVDRVDLEMIGMNDGKFRLEFHCRREGNTDFEPEPAVLIWNGAQYVRPERMGDVIFELEGDEQLEGQSLGQERGLPASASSLGKSTGRGRGSLDAKLRADIDREEKQRKAAVAGTNAQIKARNNEALQRGTALTEKVIPCYLADDGKLIFTYENLMSVLTNSKVGSKKKLRVFLEMLEASETEHPVELFGFPANGALTEEFIGLLRPLADKTDFVDLIILSRFFADHADRDLIASGDMSYQKALHQRLSRSDVNLPAPEPGLEIFDRDDEEEEEPEELAEAVVTADAGTGAGEESSAGEGVAKADEENLEPVVPPEDFRTGFHKAVEKLGSEASLKSVAAELGHSAPAEFLREAWQNGLDVFGAGVSRGEWTAGEHQSIVSLAVEFYPDDISCKAVGVRLGYETAGQFLTESRRLGVNVFTLGVMRGNLTPTEFASLVRQVIQSQGEAASIAETAQWLGYEGIAGLMKDAWKKNVNIFKLGISPESLSREEWTELARTVSEEFGAYAFLKTAAEKLGYESKIEFMKAAWDRNVSVFKLGIKRGELSGAEFEMLVRAAVQKLGENAFIKGVTELLGYEKPEEFLQAALKHHLNAFKKCGVKMGDLTLKEWSALVKTVTEHPKADTGVKPVALELGYENAVAFFREAWRRDTDVFELGVTRGTMSRKDFEELVTAAVEGLEKPFASSVAGRLGYDSGEAFLTEASDRKVDVFGLGVQKDERTRKELEDFLRQGVSEMGEAATLDIFAVRLGYPTGAGLLEEAWRLQVNVFQLGVKRGNWTPEEFSALVEKAVETLGKRVSLVWVAGRLGFDAPLDFLREAWKNRIDVFRLGVPRGKMSRETFSAVVKAAAENLKDRATLKAVGRKLGYDRVEEFLLEAWQKHENVFEDGVLRGTLTRKEFEILIGAAVAELGDDCGLKTAARWLGFDSPAEFLKEAWGRKINAFKMGIPRGKLTKTQFRALVKTAKEELGPGASALEVGRWLGYGTAEEFLADADKNRARLSPGRRSGPRKHSVSFRARVTGAVEALGDQASLEKVSQKLGFPGPEEFLTEAFGKGTKVFALGVNRGELSESEFTERVRWFAAKLGESATVEAMASWMGYEDSLTLLRDAWQREIDIFKAG